MKTVTRTLRPVAASIARLGVTGLTIALAMTSSAFAHGSYDAADVQFIQGWSSAGVKGIIIHTSGRDYRAEINGPCMGLDFALGIRFVPSGRFNTQFDRFGHLLLDDGERCYLKSFEELPRAKR
jgi:hypothetical protein